MLGTKAKGQLVYYPEVMNREETAVHGLKAVNYKCLIWIIKMATQTTQLPGLICSNRSLMKHGSNNAGFGKTTGEKQGQ